MAAVSPRLLRAVVVLALFTGGARAQCADEIAACTADSDCVGCYSARKASNEPAWLRCMAAYEDDEDPDTGVCAALKISCCLHELSLPTLSCMTNGAFVDYARCVAGSSSGLACPTSWSSCRGVDIGPVATTPPTASSSTLAPVAAETPPPTTAPVVPPVAPPTAAPVAPPTPAPVRRRTPVSLHVPCRVCACVFVLVLLFWQKRYVAQLYAPHEPLNITGRSRVCGCFFGCLPFEVLPVARVGTHR